MLTTDQVWDIEMLAAKGKAIASLLGTAAGSEDCSLEEVNLTAYVLECYFRDILKALEPVNSGPTAS